MTLWPTSNLKIFIKAMRESIPRQVDKKSLVPKEEKGVWGSGWDGVWSSQGGENDKCFFFKPEADDCMTKQLITWKDAQHHSLSEKCKSKSKWGTISHWSEWLLLKSLQTINAGEGVEKREPSYIVGGNAESYSYYGEQCRDSLKN